MDESGRHGKGPVSRSCECDAATTDRVPGRWLSDHGTSVQAVLPGPVVPVVLRHAVVRPRGVVLAAYWAGRAVGELVRLSYRLLVRSPLRDSPAVTGGSGLRRKS